MSRSSALATPVSNAKGRGIPTVIIDSGLKSEDYISFVATDNKVGGHKGGKRLAELLGGKGRVILLRYQEGSASTMNREQGFLDDLPQRLKVDVRLGLAEHRPAEGLGLLPQTGAHRLRPFRSGLDRLGHSLDLGLRRGFHFLGAGGERLGDMLEFLALAAKLFSDVIREARRA